MKIICQYPVRDTLTTTFSLPETALGRAGQPLFLPDNVGRISALPVVVAHIHRLGKHVAERFAQRYYDNWTIGLLFVFEERWEQLKSDGQPWHEAFDMDGVLRIGSNVGFAASDSRLRFNLSDEIELTYELKTHVLRETFDSLLHRTTEYNTIRQGDLLVYSLTPLPTPVTTETICLGFRGDEELLRIKLK